MQSFVTLPDAVAYISPVVAAAISGWLGQAHFKAWQNALITLGVLLTLSYLCVLIGARFTGNMPMDLLLILTYATALMYGPFRVIQKFLILGPSSQLPAVREAPPEQETLPSP